MRTRLIGGTLAIHLIAGCGGDIDSIETFESEHGLLSNSQCMTTTVANSYFWGDDLQLASATSDEDMIVLTHTNHHGNAGILHTYDWSANRIVDENTLTLWDVHGRPIGSSLFAKQLLVTTFADEDSRFIYKLGVDNPLNNFHLISYNDDMVVDSEHFTTLTRLSDKKWHLQVFKMTGSLITQSARKGNTIIGCQQSGQTSAGSSCKWPGTQEVELLDMIILNRMVAIAWMHTFTDGRYGKTHRVLNLTLMELGRGSQVLDSRMIEGVNGFARGFNGTAQNLISLRPIGNRIGIAYEIFDGQRIHYRLKKVHQNSDGEIVWQHGYDELPRETKDFVAISPRTYLSVRGNYIPGGVEVSKHVRLTSAHYAKVDELFIGPPHLSMNGRKPRLMAHPDDNKFAIAYDTFSMTVHNDRESHMTICDL